MTFEEEARQQELGVIKAKVETSDAKRKIKKLQLVNFPVKIFIRIITGVP
jgi:hypothetical protein